MNFMKKLETRGKEARFPEKSAAEASVRRNLFPADASGAKNAVAAPG
jgi:hypothetical protein